MSVEVEWNTDGLDKLLRLLPDECARYLHDGVNYGVYNEFGTHKMQAQPFIRPAIERQRGNIANVLKLEGLETLDRSIEAIAQSALADAVELCPFDTSALKNSLRVSKDKPR